MQDIWQTIFDKALDYAGFLDVSELPDIDRSSQMLLSGLLIMADWLASNTELFPLLSVEDLKPDDKLRAERAWTKLDFPQMWNPERSVISNEDFKETFGFEPRSVQSEVIKIVENSENPGIYIIESYILLWPGQILYALSRYTMMRANNSAYTFRATQQIKNLLTCKCMRSLFGFSFIIRNVKIDS